MKHFNENDFARWVEPSDEPYYIDHDLSPEEWRHSYEHWSRMAKDMTREQITQTAVDNRSMTSPVYEAMQNRLKALSEADHRKSQRQEFAEAISQKKAYDKALREHQKRRKAGKKSKRPKASYTLTVLNQAPVGAQR